MNDPKNKSNRIDQINTQANTDGGSVNTGSIDTESGDFIGRDKVNQTVNISICTFQPLAQSFIEKDADESKGISHGKWQQFGWEAAEQAYRASLIEHYGKVRLFGQNRDILLEDIFTDVYILDKPTAYRRYNIDQLIDEGVGHFRTATQSSYDSERKDGMNIVTEGYNLYILGKPGAGKTTLLKHIATQGSNHRFLDKLPIFVSLHEWANSNHHDLLPFIAKQFDICRFPDAQDFIEHFLQQGKGLLLFDGLDEVRHEGKRRQQVVQLLHDFTRKYSGCQHLITCRVAANEYTFPGFWDLEVADFTLEQVKIFAAKYFKDHTDTHEKFLKALDKEEHQWVKELCNMPLLLSLVCLYFDENKLFPQQRADLYTEAVEVLLDKWDSKRNLQRDVIFYGKLLPQRKLQMLAHIATPAFESEQYFFKSHELTTQIADYLSKLPDSPPTAYIDGEAVLKEIAAQHGLLVERASNIYSFSHLTFHEYFTARYIADNEAHGTAQVLIQNHLTDPRWREVFLLVASLIDKGDDFCQTMRNEVDIFLTQGDELKEVITWSYNHTQATDPENNRQASVRLAYMGFALVCSRCHYSLWRSFEHALERFREIARELNCAFDFARERRIKHWRESVRNRSRMSDPDLDPRRIRSSESDLTETSSLSLALATNLAKDLDVQVSLDYGLYYAWGIAEIFANSDDRDIPEVDFYIFPYSNYAISFPQLLDLCQMADDATLEKALAGLSVPQPDLSSPSASWKKLADVLADLMRAHRHLRMDWSFQQADKDTLDDYFYANELLVQCLDLAYVTDRQGFKNGLLLPPGEWQRMTEAGQ